MTLDAHIDAPWLWWKYGERDLSLPQPDRAVDFPRMREGGLDGAFLALYLSDRVQDSYPPDEINATIDAHIDLIERLRAPKGAPLIYMGLEGGRLLQDDLGRLAHLATRGVRYLTLTHNFDNEWCDSATGMEIHGGITPRGLRIVRKCEELQVLVDVSHCSSRVIDQVCGVADCPVLATHSGVRALCDHPRNLTDEEIRKIAATRGVIGVPFVRKFLGGHSPADHIYHIAQLLGGVEHIGIGSDLDGADCVISSVSQWRDVVMEGLALKGFTVGAINDIAGGNLMRMMERRGH